MTADTDAPPARSSRCPRTGSARSCVVAHPDDMEFGAAAAVARWTGQGKEVVYCMVTSGEAGIDGMAPDECRRVREAEQVESARIVGVDDGRVPRPARRHPGVRRAAARARSPRVVRRHRPEIVITGNFRDTWGGRNLNQADHIAVGRAVLDAVRDAGNRWVFPEQLADGLEPWGGVQAGVGVRLPAGRRTASTPPTRSTRASRRCEAHAAYIDGPRLGELGPARVPRGHGPRRPASGSASPFAAPFEVFPMGWGD